MILAQRMFKQFSLLRLKLTFLIVCGALAFSANAQTNIQGKVLDEAGKPVPLASVKIKGTTKGTVTDDNGVFSISASPKDVLVISFVGFVDQEVKVGTQNNVTVSLVPGASQFAEVVVTGYGTQRHSMVTSAISTVNSKTLNEIPVVSVPQALQGRVPGLQVVNNGSPGTEPLVSIRGISSITYASNPFYVVDGFPTGDLSTIDTRDIESVDVLKDASAAAIYGSRATSGVIMITTKKGKRDGKLHVNLNSYYGTNTITERLDILNPQQFDQYATCLQGKPGPQAFTTICGYAHLSGCCPYLWK